MATLLVGPSPLLPQRPDTDPGPVPAIEVSASAGSGPIDAAAWGIGLAAPFGNGLAATAEWSGWGNGFGGTTCIAESHRCSVSGIAGLLGLRIVVPAGRRPGAYGEVAGGVFRRDWIGDERVYSVALSVQAGVIVRVHGRLDARVGARFLRAFDQEYRALLDETLEYAMVTVALACRLGSVPAPRAPEAPTPTADPPPP